MRVDLVTREYPPEIYGGAGVHVAELVRALRPATRVVVRAFGAPRDEPDVVSYGAPPGLARANSALQTLGTDLEIAADLGEADLVHTHTWYANGAGRLAQLLHGVPHVMTAHSLEPLRPWKAEQLGGGYRLSSRIEREAIEHADAVIAVSDGMRRDVLRSYPSLDPDRVRVIRNGIDTERWRPRSDAAVLAALGIDSDRPAVTFVGRITRQKGLPYLLRAAAELPSDAQLVLCAGSADTPELEADVSATIAELQASRSGVVWIREHLPVDDVIAVLSASTVFVCPSIYEPLGIVNLEAMACEVPVVATATGGIPEVVDDGVTGVLVPIEQAQDGTGTPLHPDRFVADLAAALRGVLADPAGARRMGLAGRRRAADRFSWATIAESTRSLYEEILRG